jgi:hypothetical protein
VIELLVLIVLTVIALVFIITSIRTRTRDDKIRPTHSSFPTADEAAPSQTGIFKVQAMLNKEKKRAQIKQKKQEASSQSDENEEILPDPFDDS